MSRLSVHYASSLKLLRSFRTTHLDSGVCYPFVSGNAPVGTFTPVSEREPNSRMG